MKSSLNLVLRLAPSQTGFCHPGTIYIALLNTMAYKTRQDNILILRWDDTDESRNHKLYEEDIIKSFSYMCFQFTRSFKQSDRHELYLLFLNRLLKSDLAYTCVCIEQNCNCASFRLSLDKTVRVKFSIANYIQKFGKSVTFLNNFANFSSDVSNMKDFLLMRSNYKFVYHFASVIDDAECQITHVIRGSEWLTSTAKHIMLFHSIGSNVPGYVHVSVIRDVNGKKLSKRKKDGCFKYWIEEGYIPTVIQYYLVGLGYPHASEEHIKNFVDIDKELQNLQAVFSLEKIKITAPRLDIDKLRYINRIYISTLSDKDFLVKLEYYLSFCGNLAIVELFKRFTYDRVLKFRNEKGISFDTFYELFEQLSKLVSMTDKEIFKEYIKNKSESFKLFTNIIEANDSFLNCYNAIKKQIEHKANLFHMLRFILLGSETGLPMDILLKYHLIQFEEMKKYIHELC